MSNWPIGDAHKFCIYLYIFSGVQLAHRDDYAIQVIHNQFATENRNNLKSIVRFNDYGCLITESSLHKFQCISKSKRITTI